MIKLDREFVIWSLGGYGEVNRLGDQFGVNIYDLLEDGSVDSWFYLYNTQVGNRKFFTSYNNYQGGIDKQGRRTRPYPDLTITLLAKPSEDKNGFNYVNVSATCSDIGYRQTQDEAKKKIRDWFHEEAIPIILEYVFS